MNSTALGAENIIFISEAHEKFAEVLLNARRQDKKNVDLIYKFLLRYIMVRHIC